MKKLLKVSAILLLTVPSFAFAYVPVTPGPVRHPECQFTQSYSCDDDQEMQIRVNTLEKAVIELQTENTGLKVRLDQQAQSVGGTLNNQSIEARVLVLEKTVGVLTTQIMQALTAMIGMIQKIAR